MNLNKNDVLIVGCGFSGAVAARCLAESGRRVIILEKRGHIAGNMFDEKDENGVLVHRYGPHIFHTSIKEVFDFLKRFSDFFPYSHRVLGKIDGQFVPIPFNFTSAEKLFGAQKAQKLENALVNAFPGKTRVPVTELLKGTDADVKFAGNFIFEKVFLHYTAKQWGMPADKVDRSVLSRVPVVLGRDDRYFSDEFQYMPQKGYNELFKNLLSHENIEIVLNCDASKRLRADTLKSRLFFDGEELNCDVIWTAPADELFGYSNGRLPYRSLDLKFERFDKTEYQPAAVVNYPNEEDFTRITEFKYLTGQRLEGKTTIMKEYPLIYNPDSGRGNIPYYPIISAENLALYDSYKKLAGKFKNLHFCGRLAEYKYYNMDKAVARALDLSREILK